MYKSVRIEGLRGIKYIEIKDFQNINLFVGKNNCGKTTLLESVFLLTGASNPQLPLNINAFRQYHIVNESTFRTFFNNFDVDSNIKIFGELVKPEEKRDLVIKPDRSTITIIDKDTAEKESIEPRLGDTGISRPINGLVLEFTSRQIGRKDITVNTHVTVKGTNVEVKLPDKYQEQLKGVFLSGSGVAQDLKKRFDNILIKKQITRIVDSLKKIEPSLEGLSIDSTGTIFCDIGLKRLIPIQMAGNGMFKLLSILLAIANFENGYIFIDEIENGFHYASQEIMWNAVFQFAKDFNVQIFASSHSYDCVNALASAYSKYAKNKLQIMLYRIEKRGEELHATSYDYKTLKESLISGWEVR